MKHLKVLASWQILQTTTKGTVHTQQIEWEVREEKEKRDKKWKIILNRNVYIYMYIMSFSVQHTWTVSLLSQRNLSWWLNCIANGVDKGVTKGNSWTQKRECPSRWLPHQYWSRLGATHAPSVTFRHLPPNSARFSYATEGALFISAQLSTNVVSTLWKVWVLIGLWKRPNGQAGT